MNDIITLNKLRVLASIGILPHERAAPQEIEITVRYATDAAPLAIQDDIQEAINYAEVREQMIQFAQSQHFNLIETLAEKSAQLLLARFSLTWVQITVCKPDIFPDAQGVFICVERRK